MVASERRISTWDLLRSVLSILAMLAAGGASLSARLMVERSDRQDAQIERRLEVLEGTIGNGELARIDERIMQIRRDIERLERALERHVEDDGQHP